MAGQLATAAAASVELLRNCRRVTAGAVELFCMFSFMVCFAVVSTLTGFDVV
jgi:hypothetical protein